MFVLYVYLLWSAYNYYITNNNYYNSFTIPYFFNNLLTNPLNKYHPILFFSSFIFIFKIVQLTNVYQIYRNSFYTNFFLLNLYKSGITKLFLYLSISLTSLYLGSWWALQEGSWGGWWNWDSSEVFGLLILTFILLVLHTLYINLFIQKFIFFVFYILLVLSIYAIIQMGYSVVSHNFGLNIINYAYVNMTFISIVFVSLLSYYFTYKILQKYIKFRKFIYHANLNSYVTGRNLTTTIILILLGYLYLLSFNPVLNNILPTLLNLNLSMDWVYPINPKLYLLLFTITVFISIQSSLIILLVTLFTWISINKWFLIIFTVITNIRLSVFHTLLTITLLQPIYLNYSTFIIWEYLNTMFTDFSGIVRRSPYSNYPLINDAFIIMSSPNLYDSLQIEFHNSFVWFNSNTNLQFFILDNSDTFLKQQVINQVLMYTSKITIYDLSPSLLDTTFSVVVCLLYLFFCKHLLVIF